MRYQLEFTEIFSPPLFILVGLIVVYLVGVDQLFVHGVKKALSYSRNLSESTHEESGIRKGLYILFVFKMILLVLNRFLYPFRVIFWRLFGVYYYQLDRTGSVVYKTSRDRFYRHASKLVENAISVKMALGEAGSRFLEEERMRNGMKKAAEEGVDLEIIHGPRVDPETKTIFSLAREEKLQVYKNDDYQSHHFTLIETKKGEKFVLDEGIHDETLWNPETGKAIWSDLTRCMYIYKPSSGFGQFLQSVFEERKRGATPVIHNIGISKKQTVIPSKLLASAFTTNLVKQHILQPLSILFQRRNRRIF
jgi:hypothetical protein